MGKIVAGSNQLEQVDQIAAEGQSRIQWTPDTALPLCGIITIQHEDHSMKEMLKDVLLRDARVRNVGVRLPHPHEARIEIRLETIDCPPLVVFAKALETIQGLSENLQSQLDKSENLSRQFSSWG